MNNYLEELKAQIEELDMANRVLADYHLPTAEEITRAVNAENAIDWQAATRTLLAVTLTALESTKITYPIGELYWNKGAIFCRCGNCGHHFNTTRGKYRCPQCGWLPPHEELLSTLPLYEEAQGEE